jgi:FAD/FMN-containing dehydrogenase
VCSVTQQHSKEEEAMTDEALAEILAAKAARHAKFVQENAETQYFVQITIPVKGLARAVEMFDALVDAANPLNAAYEAEINDDNSYSAYVLDEEGGAVH